MMPVLKEKPSKEPGRVFKAWYECPSCAQEVSKGDKYCSQCGIKFT